MSSFRKKTIQIGTAVAVAALLLAASGASAQAVTGTLTASTTVRVPDFDMTIPTGALRSLSSATDEWTSAADWTGISETPPSDLAIAFLGGTPAGITVNGNMVDITPSTEGLIKAQFVLTYTVNGVAAQTAPAWMVVNVTNNPAPEPITTLTTYAANPYTRVTDDFIAAPGPVINMSNSVIASLTTEYEATPAAGVSYPINLNLPATTSLQYTGRVWPAIAGGASGQASFTDANGTVFTFSGSTDGRASVSMSGATNAQGQNQTFSTNASFIAERTNGELVGVAVFWQWGVPALAPNDIPRTVAPGQTLTINSADQWSIGGMWGSSDTALWVTDSPNAGFTLSADGTSLSFTSNTPGIYTQPFRIKASPAGNTSEVKTLTVTVTGPTDPPGTTPPVVSDPPAVNTPVVTAPKPTPTTPKLPIVSG